MKRLILTALLIVTASVANASPVYDLITKGKILSQHTTERGNVVYWIAYDRILWECRLSGIMNTKTFEWESNANCYVAKQQLK